MYKFIQVHTGENSFNFRVTGLFTVVFIAKTSAAVNLRVQLLRRGAHATIIGIILGRGQSIVTIHTSQIHAAPQTTSNLLVKSVLRDTSKCLYDGGIIVKHAAQQTNAYQRNENLLLSSHAYCESKPVLEIQANDVRCTHGATAGPIDKEQLWYAQSRGLSKEAAERFIIDGFIQSAFDQISDKRVRAEAQKFLLNTV